MDGADAHEAQEAGGAAGEIPVAVKGAKRRRSGAAKEGGKKSGREKTGGRANEFEVGFI